MKALQSSAPCENEADKCLYQVKKQKKTPTSLLLINYRWFWCARLMDQLICLPKKHLRYDFILSPRPGKGPSVRQGDVCLSAPTLK